MTAATRLTGEDTAAFLERFGHFEDGVITGIRLHLPRSPLADRTATLDIQAVDVPRNAEWRLVRLTVGGVRAYRFPYDADLPHLVLSDGLNLHCAPGSAVLDLDPGPDPWSPAQVGRPGPYSAQYASGAWCDYEVLDGPFI